MRRLLYIVVAVLSLSSVFAATGIYAAPAEARVAAAVGDMCIEKADEAHLVAGKICVKRHMLGLPCTPAPAILPDAVVLGEVESVAVPLRREEPEATGRGWARFYRPPRALLT